MHSLEASAGLLLSSRASLHPHVQTTVPFSRLGMIARAGEHRSRARNTTAAAACRRSQMPQGVLSGKDVFHFGPGKSAYICAGWCMLMHDAIRLMLKSQGFVRPASSKELFSALPGHACLPWYCCT